VLRKLRLLPILFFFLAPSATWAFVSPVGVSLVPPLEFPWRSASVIGARLNLIFGLHSSVYGFDFGGIGNMTDRNFGGVQLAGAFNRNAGDAHVFGLQAASVFNWNVKEVTIIGLQLTGGFNYNRGSKSALYGLGIGGIGNYCQGQLAGVQIGLYNQAGQVYGVQIGLINVAKDLHGLQIGLVNLSKTGGLLPFFPILHIGI
jgi:hypothetical protein